MSQKFIFVNADGDYEESTGAFESSDFINVSTGTADAGKPIVLDADGKVDDSMIDASGIDHGGLSGLGDDDHTQYILVDGSRAFTGNIDAGSHLGVNFLDPVNDQDAATKAYVDLVAQGLKPHGNARVASTGNVDISSAPASIDGVTLVNGDRVLLWQQTSNLENGVYIFNGSGSAMTRADDFDCDTNGEVYNGSFIPEITEGTTYEKYSFVVTSVGSGTDGEHVCGTDPIVFDIFVSPRDYTGDQGIYLNHTTHSIAVDILDTDSGLGFFGTGSDELGIDWATTFTIDAADDKALMASDLASTTSGEGASIIGIEDANGYFTSDDVEGALDELYNQASTPIDTNTFTAGSAISKGDLVYMSANDEVSTHPGNSNVYAIGIAKDNAAAAATVEILKDDTILPGILSGATAGTKYYWDGSGWATSLPVFSGFYVWRIGAAKNATDAYVDVEFVKRNS
jgi:hypothetical protein